MKNTYWAFGEIQLHVSKEFQAEGEQNAWEKIYKMVNENTADIRKIKIETVNGEVHEIDVNDFCIIWKEVCDKAALV